MLERFFPELNKTLIPYFRYRTPKFILVEVPLVGIVHRLCQLGALAYVISNLFMGSGWSVKSVPLGSVNPWVELGDYSTMAETTSSYDSLQYCSNPAFAYNYGGGFIYGTAADPPICDSPNTYTVTEKTVNSVFLTTAYIHNQEAGFPCDGGNAGSGTAFVPEDECTQKLGAGSNVVKYANGQCVCKSPTKTYYPLGVEQMEVVFEHFFHTLETVKVDGQTLKGSSSIADAENPLRTRFEFSNHTYVDYDAGVPIKIKVADLLQAAHHAVCEKGSVADKRDGKDDGKCETGIVLDERNVDVQADADDTSKFPYFRTTGVSVSLNIAYTNANEDQRAELNNREVISTVKATVQTGAWSSVGGTTTYQVYPSGEIGAQTWELSSRYKQGVMVHMMSSGTIYSFDFFNLVTVLITGLVLLKTANTVADFVAFFCLGAGQSLVLRNKRCEKVSKKSEFAETGLKAALAAHQFNFFDRDHNGSIEASDIVRAFANIENSDGGPAVSCEQAHAIATAIMDDADVDDASKDALDFSEYMTCLDGDALSFNAFLTKLQLQTELSTYKECKDSYDAQRKESEKNTNRRKPISERLPGRAAEISSRKASTSSRKGAMSTTELTGAQERKREGGAMV